MEWFGAWDLSDLPPLGIYPAIPSESKQLFKNYTQLQFIKLIIWIYKFSFTHQQFLHGIWPRRAGLTKMYWPDGMVFPSVLYVTVAKGLLEANAADTVEHFCFHQPKAKMQQLLISLNPFILLCKYGSATLLRFSLKMIVI